jgi:hypothetical protein
MPRPQRDYKRLFKAEIEKVSIRITRLENDRHKLMQAYELITGESYPATDVQQVPRPTDSARTHRKKTR